MDPDEIEVEVEAAPPAGDGLVSVENVCGADVRLAGVGDVASGAVVAVPEAIARQLGRRFRRVE